jgi:hypothetical protein
MRFPRLLHWSGLLVFAALVLPWHIWLQHSGHAVWFLSRSRDFDVAAPDQVGLVRFISGHFVWWFPMLLLVLPGALFASRRVFRPCEIDFADALPLCWIAVGFLPLLFFPNREHINSLPMWSAFALWSACAWDRLPPPFQVAGTALAAILCVAGTVALTSERSRTWIIGTAVDADLFHGTLMLAGVAASLCAFAGAAYLLWRKRETLATAVLLLGMLPLDLAIAECDARLGPQFSFGSIAGFLQSRLGEDGEVIYDGSERSGSSLGFYLDTAFSIVGESGRSDHALSESGALERFGASQPVYLIMHKDRLPFWQERLTERYHIYHQVSTCGSYVVVNNQP